MTLSYASDCLGTNNVGVTVVASLVVVGHIEVAWGDVRGQNGVDVDGCEYCEVVVHCRPRESNSK